LPSRFPGSWAFCLAHPDFLSYACGGKSQALYQCQKVPPVGAVYFYPLVIAATYFPWSLLLPEEHGGYVEGKMGKAFGRSTLHRLVDRGGRVLVRLLNPNSSYILTGYRILRHPW